MEQPTNDQLLRIFAAYAPCRVFDTISEKEVDMNAISFNEGMIEFGCKSDADWGNVEYFKLILKPLNTITDEDAIEVSGIVDVWTENECHLPPDEVKEWLDEVFTGNCATYADYVSGKEFQELLDFLRSRSYDCGFGSIPSLITAGIAIAAKTTEA